MEQEAAGRATTDADAEVVRLFEATTLTAFPHEAHVRVAWWYLQHAPLPDAMGQFMRAIRRFAAAKGASAKYHETVTVAWVLLIAQRVGETPTLKWVDFAAHHADLFSQPSPLERYYEPATLASDRARRGFVMPDRLAPPRE